MQASKSIQAVLGQPMGDQRLLGSEPLRIRAVAGVLKAPRTHPIETVSGRMYQILRAST